MFETLKLSGFLMPLADGQCVYCLQILCENDQSAEEMSELIPAMIAYEMGEAGEVVH